MKMRGPESRVSGVRDDVALADVEFSVRRIVIDGVRPSAVLFCPRGRVDRFIESQEMRVRAVISVGMPDVEHFSVAVRRDADPVDFAVTDRKNLVAGLTVRPDVDSSVKMSCPVFRKCRGDFHARVGRPDVVLQVRLHRVELGSHGGGGGRRSRPRFRPRGAP
jgi:hypothetical protein